MEILNHLQGHTHQVITGIAVIHVEDGVMLERTVEHVSTDVRMRRCTQGELQAYIATGEPRDKAGAYGIQGYGAMFIEGIIGDYFVVGYLGARSSGMLPISSFLLMTLDAEMKNESESYRCRLIRAGR